MNSPLLLTMLSTGLTGPVEVEMEYRLNEAGIRMQ
jgi:hypothetical protein